MTGSVLLISHQKRRMRNENKEWEKRKRYMQISKSWRHCYLPPTRLMLSSDMLWTLSPNWETMVVAFWSGFSASLALENPSRTAKVEFGFIEKTMTATGNDMKSTRKSVENLLEVILVFWGLASKISMICWAAEVAKKMKEKQRVHMIWKSTIMSPYPLININILIFFNLKIILIF